VSDAYQRLVKALSSRYRLERELGSGGMATVYLAEDLKHQRQVAIKVLRPELAATLGAERFDREIATAARFQHPHILPLLESGHTGGFLYYVMPYVEGESLRERLTREGELPIHDAVKILIEVTDALAYAHALGIVHRDIKPENVLLSRRHALVTDFGVAKALSDAARDRSVTTTGVAVGTPTYMAPEQAAADPHIDQRADIYGVGVLGYELLTGQPPFTGKGAAEILAAQVTQVPEPLDTRRPACPAPLAQVIMKCLEKRPADRWQTADELLATLEPLATPTGGTTPTTTRPIGAAAPERRRPRWLAVATGAGVLLVAGVLIFSPRHAAVLSLSGRAQLTLDPGLEIEPALSPDGKLIAYVAGPVNAMKLYVRQLDGGAPTPVVRDAGGWQRSPSWSADGRRLLYWSPRGIEVVPAFGGSPRLLLAGSRVTAPGTIAPDGEHFAFASGDSVYVGSVDGGTTHLVTTAPAPYSFSWSPDGTRIAFVAGNINYLAPITFGNIAPSGVWTVAAAGGTAVRATDEQWFNASPVWTRDGRSLLYVSSRAGGRDVFQQALTRSGRPSGPPAQVTTGLSALSIGLSADGRRLAYAQFTETSNVWSINLAPGAAVSISQARPLTNGNQTIEGFGVSPDGRWLAFDSNRGGEQRIYRMRLPGGEPQQLTNDSVSVFFPQWSPDGGELVMHGFRGDRRQLFVVAADGGPLIQVTTGADHRFAVWRPDAHSVGMVAEFGTGAGHLAVSSRGSDGSWSAPQAVPLVLERDTLRGRDVGAAAWSPDGRWLACAWRGGLAIAPAAGGQVRNLPLPARAVLVVRPQWSADSRWIYYLALDSSGVVGGVNGVPVAGGPPHVFVRFDDPTRPWHRYGFGVHAQTVYVTLGDLESDIWVADITSRR
jgi:Tol biopolymer transport system component